MHKTLGWVTKVPIRGFWSISWIFWVFSLLITECLWCANDIDEVSQIGHLLFILIIYQLHFLQYNYKNMSILCEVSEIFFVGLTFELCLQFSGSCNCIMISMFYECAQQGKLKWNSVLASSEIIASFFS